jgi:aspartyl-tRNA(Asn)/glutamyl-tRNA(Gln) amidotransferase subunit A
MYMEDMYTIPASLAWLPGFSIPAGYAKPEDGEDIELPVWIQLTGSYQGEEKLFEIAHVFEQNSKVKTVVAPQFRD